MDKERFIRSLALPDEDCPICKLPYSPEEFPVRTACGHWFHRECLVQAVEHAPSPHTCPYCRDPMYSPGEDEEEDDDEDDDEDEDEEDEDEDEYEEYYVGSNWIPNLGGMSYGRMWKERWDKVADLSDAEHAALVGYIWRTIRRYSALNLTDSGAFTHLATVHLLTGIMLNVGRDIYRDPDCPFSDALLRYIEFSAIRIDDHLSLPVIERRFGDEPLRSLIKMMMSLHSFIPADSLSTDIALLCWKAAMVLFKYRESYLALATVDEATLVIHFLLVIENLSIVNGSTEQRMMFERTSYFWYLVNFNLNLDHSFQFRRSLRREVLHLQQMSGSQDSPVFTGAPSESEEVCRIMLSPLLQTSNPFSNGHRRSF
ncbi:hypothetical protein BU26DRAFT_606203 [Trematosphaeria pertusa]|uniref:RING-type domain-containing protein n=1 Tax=Trematosphaeria pertusa TaxID=390896 RepID=A0A6A6I9Z0_9PLEO|nr:uncharacterized protein BU26DRAFT_606203 [Trematosphaeria pertusa]KAF2247196.1 hypothetical protein BU26DRAFT_606203 [Trematosphaeria pertusa]